MAKLIAKTALAGLLPATIGTVTLTEVDAGEVTLIAPFNGQKKAVSDALKAAHGVAFPAPNRSTSKGDVRMVWCGFGQALLMGAACPKDLPAACVDQTDASAIVTVSGAGAVDVLERLTPIDLRNAVFKRGHTARSLIAHMPASITRLGVDTYEVSVMRSMAATLVHDLTQAAENVAARADLPA